MAESINDRMAVVYAALVQKGKKTIKQAPKNLQAAVKAILAGDSK